MGEQPSRSIGLLYSGGLDSSMLLARLLHDGLAVFPIYVAAGLVWEKAELQAARRFLRAVAEPRLAKLTVLELPLADLYGDHWSVTGQGVPAADSPDEAVYLLGRNPLLAIKARLWCQLRGIPRLAIGCLGTSPFADASPDFFARFEEVMDCAARGHVNIVRPLPDKLQALRSSSAAPWELTWSCLAPRDGLHCGACNKCAERQAAFSGAELADNTPYAGAPRFRWLATT